MTVKEFKHQDEMIVLSFGGKQYSFSSGKALIIEELGAIFKSEGSVREIMNKAYDLLIDLIGKEAFDDIFKDHRYDMMFFVSFFEYLQEVGTPTMIKLNDRLRAAQEKYDVQPLDAPPAGEK